MCRSGCKHKKTPGYKTCPSCRTRNRAKMRRYRASKSRSFQNYQRSHDRGRRALANAWARSHPDRKRLHALLRYYVSTGVIIKPPRCQDCKSHTTPIVAWGLRLTRKHGLIVGAWTCWACWWLRYRALATGYPPRGLANVING